MQGVAVPEMTPEIALATIARFAQDRGDPKLTTLTADIAGAYGRGPVALQGPVVALNQYAYDNYHWGDRALSMQLVRPIAALMNSIGADSATVLDARPPDQRTEPKRATPASQPAASTPQPPQPRVLSRDPGGDAAVQRMIAGRDANQRDMDTFYADPNYQRERAGDPDESLDEAYLLRRRRLFGKSET